MGSDRARFALFSFLLAAAIALGVVATVDAQGQQDVSPCRLSHSKWAEPSFLWLGDWTTVTLTSTTVCPSKLIPLHIVLSIDGSRSMDIENKLVNAKRAAVQFVNEMDFDVTTVGVNRFGREAQVMTALTDQKGQVLSAINRIYTNGGTKLEDAVALSHRMLSEARAENTDPDVPPAIEAIVILSDGQVNLQAQNPLRPAARAKGEGILIMSVCVGSYCDRALMRNLASRPDLFFDVQQSSRLVGVYQEIAHQLLETELRRLTVRDEVPDNMKYIDGSANVPPDSFDDDVLTWNLNTISTSGITLTYELEPLEEGIWPTNVEAVGEFRDTDDRIGSYVFPVPTVEVRIPTPTPTLAPSPNYTPSAVPAVTQSPTPTESPTSTPTLTRTPVPVPETVYLPILLREACVAKRVSVDAVLVLDTSTSMRGQALGDLTNREAGVQVARMFLQRLDLNHDQVGLVVFDDDARVLHALGRDDLAVERSLESVPGRMGTRIDEGLLAGLGVLQGRGRVPAHTKAMLLITDGVPTRSSAAKAADAGTSVREAGVELFVVGIGDDADSGLLRRIAGEAGRYFERERVDELESDLDHLYDQVTSLDPCGGATYWSRR